MDSYQDSPQSVKKQQFKFDPGEKEKERNEQVRSFINGIQENPEAIKYFLRELNKSGIKQQRSQRAEFSTMSNTNNDYFDSTQSKYQSIRPIQSRGMSTAVRTRRNILSTGNSTRGYLSRGNDSTSMEKESPSSFGKQYFKKYIDATNKKLHEIKMRQQRRFIPEKETEKKTYKQKFDHYLQMLGGDEREKKPQTMRHTMQGLSLTSPSILEQKNMLTEESNQNNQSSLEVSKSKNQIKAKEFVVQEHKVSESSLSKKQKETNFLRIKSNTIKYTRDTNQTNTTESDYGINKRSNTLGWRFTQDRLGGNRSYDRSNSPLKLGYNDLNAQRDFERSSKMENKNGQDIFKSQKYENLYQESMKRVKDQIQFDYFKIICQEVSKEQFKSARLTKINFKKFLAQRYGNMIADKLQHLIDFSNSVDYAAYQTQIEAFLKNRDLLIQVGFDVYDSNGDGKISEMDLFKIFQQFDKNNYETFEKAIYKDMCILVKMLKAKFLKNEYTSPKRKFVLEEELARYFRNINDAQPNFGFQQKRKQIFQSMYKMIQMAQTGREWGSKLFSTNAQEGPGLITQIELQQNEKEEQGRDEKEEDFFSSSTYHQFLAKRRPVKHKSVFSQQTAPAQANSSQKPNKKQAIVPYMQHKILKIKTQANQGQVGYGTSQITPNSTSGKSHGLTSPLWDGYFTTYLEDTQLQITEFIKFEEFQNIKFQQIQDISGFILDLIDYLTGTKSLFANSIQSIHKKVVQEHRKSITHDIDAFIMKESDSERDDDSAKSVSPRTSKARNKRESQINKFRAKASPYAYKCLSNSFQILAQGFHNELTNLHDIVLTKQSIKENFVKLFKEDSSYMAQIMYMQLAKNKDSAYIDFVRFGKCFLPLYEVYEADNKEKQNQFIFRFLDLDKDGKLSILSCIQMFKNLPKNSKIAQEIYLQTQKLTFQIDKRIQGQDNSNEEWVQRLNPIELF